MPHQSSLETGSTAIRDKWRKDLERLLWPAGCRWIPVWASQGWGQYWYSVYHAAHTHSQDHGRTLQAYIIHEKVRDEGQCPVSPLELLTCAIHPPQYSPGTHTHTSWGKSSSNESKAVSLCWVCVCCSQEWVKGPAALNRGHTLHRNPSLLRWSNAWQRGGVIMFSI